MWRLLFNILFVYVLVLLTCDAQDSPPTNVLDSDDNDDDLTEDIKNDVDNEENKESFGDNDTENDGDNNSESDASSGETNVNNGEYNVHVEVNVDKKKQKNIFHSTTPKKVSNMNATLKATKLLDKIVSKLQSKGQIHNLTNEFNNAIDETLGLNKATTSNVQIHKSVENEHQKYQEAKENNLELMKTEFQTTPPEIPTGFNNKGVPLKKLMKESEASTSNANAESPKASSELSDSVDTLTESNNSSDDLMAINENEVEEKSHNVNNTTKLSPDVINNSKPDQKPTVQNTNTSKVETDSSITKEIAVDEINIRLPSKSKDKSFKIDIQNPDTDENMMQLSEKPKDLPITNANLGNTSISSQSDALPPELPSGESTSITKDSVENMSENKSNKTTSAATSLENQSKGTSSSSDESKSNTAEIIIHATDDGVTNNEKDDEDDDEDDEDEDDEAGDAKEPSNVNQNIASSITGKSLTISFQENTGNLGNDEFVSVTPVPSKISEQETRKSDSNIKEINGKRNKGPTTTEKASNTIVDMHKGRPMPKLFNDSLFEQAAKVSQEILPGSNRHTVMNVKKPINKNTDDDSTNDNEDSEDDEEDDDGAEESGDVENDSHFQHPQILNLHHNEADDDGDNDNDDRDEKVITLNHYRKTKAFGRLKNILALRKSSKTEDNEDDDDDDTDDASNKRNHILQYSNNVNKKQKKNELMFGNHGFDTLTNKKQKVSHFWTNAGKANDVYTSPMFRKGQVIPKPPNTRGQILVESVEQLPEVSRSYKKSEIKKPKKKFGSKKKKKPYGLRKQLKLHGQKMKTKTGNRRIAIPTDNPDDSMSPADVNALIKDDALANMQNMPEYGDSNDPWSPSEVTSVHDMLGSVKDSTWSDPYSVESRQFEGIEPKAMKDLSAIQNYLQGSQNPEREALDSINSYAKEGTTAALFDPERNSEKEAMQSLNKVSFGDETHAIGLPENDAPKNPMLFGDMSKTDSMMDFSANDGVSKSYPDDDSIQANMNSPAVSPPSLNQPLPNQNDVPVIMPPHQNPTDMGNNVAAPQQNTVALGSPETNGPDEMTDHMLKNKDGELEKAKKVQEQEFIEQERIAEEKFDAMEKERGQEEQKYHGNGKATYVAQRKHDVTINNNTHSHKEESKEQIDTTRSIENTNKLFLKNTNSHLLKLKGNHTTLLKSFDSAVETSDGDINYGPSNQQDAGEEFLMSKRKLITPKIKINNED